MSKSEGGGGVEGACQATGAAHGKALAGSKVGTLVQGWLPAAARGGGQ